MGATVLQGKKEKGLETSQATNTASLPIPGGSTWEAGCIHHPSRFTDNFRSFSGQEEAGNGVESETVGCCALAMA